MSKIKIGLLSIIVASSLNAFDFNLPSANGGSGGSGVSFDIKDILGLPSGNILGSSTGPLKYSCKLNLDNGKFNFNLGDFALDKLSKSLDFGIFSCEIEVDMDKAVCKDKLWGKLQKKGYGLLGDAKNKAKGKASEGKEWLKDHVFDWEVGEESAWGKGVQTIDKYCSDIDDKTDEIVKNRIKKRQEDNAYDALIQYVFQGDTDGAIRLLHKNSGFKDEIEEIVNRVATNGGKPTEDDINAVRQAYSKFIPTINSDLTSESIEKSKTFANQSAKGLGLMNDSESFEFLTQIQQGLSDVQKRARESSTCSSMNGIEWRECVKTVATELEKKLYDNNGDFAKGLNDLNAKRKQSQETIMDLKLKANPKKSMLSAEQISNSPMTQSDKARHYAELKEYEAKETLEEIRLNNQILLQDELGRLEFKHTAISAESFDLNAALKETSDIIKKAEESATNTVNAIIGGGSGGGGGIPTPF